MEVLWNSGNSLAKAGGSRALRQLEEGPGGASYLRRRSLAFAGAERPPSAVLPPQPPGARITARHHQRSSREAATQRDIAGSSCAQDHCVTPSRASSRTHRAPAQHEPEKPRRKKAGRVFKEQQRAAEGAATPAGRLGKEKRP